MRLRKQIEQIPDAAEDPGAPDPQADVTDRAEIADDALTRERRYHDAAFRLRKTDDSTPGKAGRRRDSRSRRRSEPADSDGLTPEVLSRLSKYGMKSDVLARQKRRREEDEDEPWRK